MIDFLKIKDYAVIGSFSCTGVCLIFCLFAPFYTKSQVIFLKQDGDFNCYEKIDFLFVSVENLKKIIQNTLILRKIKNIIVLSNDKEEVSRIISGDKKRIIGSIFLINDELICIQF